MSTGSLHPHDLVTDAPERIARDRNARSPCCSLDAKDAEEQVLGTDVVVAELSGGIAGRRDGVSRVMAEALKHSEPPVAG